MAEPLRRRVRARVLRGLTRAVGLTPPAFLRGGLRLAAAAARHTRYERRARANLELALGGETSAAERERIAAGVRRHAARQLAEWLRLARGAPPAGPAAARGRWIEDAVAIDDSIEVLDAELARGRGAIVVTAHIGNWELLCAALRRHGGYPGAVVGLERRRDSSSDWLVEMRRAYGVETIAQRSHPRRILRVLQDGGVLGLLCDLEVRRLAGEFVPFFGHPALTMTAPAALARAHRAPLLPARCVLGADGRYRLGFDEPLALDPVLERAAAARDLLERLNRRYEVWIRAAPEQWAWHQPRWRTRPGEIETVPLAARGAS